MLRGLLSAQAALLGRARPNLAPPPLALVPSRGRKSRHDPPAKSKADRIKTPPPVDPAELLVVLRRYEQHRGVLGALRAEFREEVLQQQYSMAYGEESQQKKAAEVEEHRQLMAWNDAENRRLQERRLERLWKEELEEKERKLQTAQEQAKFMDDFLQERQKEVLQLQEEAKNFITHENLDQKIEECLNNPRNYNFAIDKEGRVAKRSVLP